VSSHDPALYKSHARPLLLLLLLAMMMMMMMMTTTTPRRDPGSIEVVRTRWLSENAVIDFLTGKLFALAKYHSVGKKQSSK
jgi:hypothetical protein